ncbi:metallophosphoesterase [Pseudomonas sp. NA-150]|uniref:metallophosphoesterase n=1 Tax=Pseudomonas sp. NA-150 TaxID=3367525 RepID=UPI0037CC7A98
MSKFQHFERNTTGRDFAVGDIHGHFTRLRATLEEVDFDRKVDRLFSVGDLVDRGPESRRSLDWLSRPWFFAVQGNHEALAIQHVQHQNLDYQMYKASGGSWFLKLGPNEQQRFAARFARMPIAMEVDTAGGLVGLVHADCPAPGWEHLRETLRGHLPGLEALEETCQWSRERLQTKDSSGIADLRALIVGHSPLRSPAQLGNVFHIDTGGWRSDGTGHFTLVNLSTLEVLAPGVPAPGEVER